MRKFVWLFAFIFVFITALPISANDGGKIRLGVLEFESRTKVIPQLQAESITDIFTRILANSKNITVYERQMLAKIGEEVHRGSSGLADSRTAVEAGKIAGVQYILLGSISETNKATITVDIRVIDTATSEIKLALSETVSAEGTSGSTAAQAMSDAANRLAYSVRSILGGESSNVISSGASEVLIDAGSNMGVKEGDIYLVYAEGKTIRGMENEIVGREKIPLAVIKVKEVSALHSSCSIAPPSDPKMVKRGDKVEPIAAEKAKNLKFVADKPTTTPSPAPERLPTPPVANKPTAPKPTPERVPTPPATGNNTSLMEAARNARDPQVITTLVKSGGNVNARDSGGWTPLMIAGYYNSNLGIITALIQAGANVNVRNEKSWTPLMKAAENNSNPEVITALVNAGANVNEKTKDGWTPLMIAGYYNSNLGVITALIQAGANVNVRNEKSSTLLMKAAENNPNPVIIVALVEAGADIKARDNNNWTPLMYASRYNSKPEIVTALIRAGSDVHARNKGGWTPLMVAGYGNPNPEIIAALIGAGADINAKANNGWTVLACARSNDKPNSKVIAALIKAGAR